jgi:glutathione S-transferase
MTIEMYDLAAADPDVRFSPYCWRARMALAHKGLSVTTIPWRFTEKDKIAFSGQGLVPVLRDGDRVVHDSWTIAEYLDDAYPERPRLMDGPQGRALANFARHYVQTVISPVAMKAVLLDIWKCLDERDKPYFRESREKRLGGTLEQLTATPEASLAAMKTAVATLRGVVQSQPFVNGERPAFADYCVFGAFMWARNVSKVKLLAEDDPVYAWRERMFDLFDGLARKSPGVGA